MTTMNQSLLEQVQKRLLSKEDAINNSTVPDELVNMIQKVEAASRNTKR